jgi:hypothetical protein
MESFALEMLEQFIVQAKQNTYVGGSQKLLPYRLGSKDLQLMEGDWAYHDSYLGESDFIGQEIVYFQMKPVWDATLSALLGHVTTSSMVDSRCRSKSTLSGTGSAA